MKSRISVFDWVPPHHLINENGYFLASKSYRKCVSETVFWIISSKKGSISKVENIRIRNWKAKENINFLRIPHCSDISEAYSSDAKALVVTLTLGYSVLFVHHPSRSPLTSGPLDLCYSRDDRVKRRGCKGGRNQNVLGSSLFATLPVDKIFVMYFMIVAMIQ